MSCQSLGKFRKLLNSRKANWHSTKKFEKNSACEVKWNGNPRGETRQNLGIPKSGNSEKCCSTSELSVWKFKPKFWMQWKAPPIKVHLYNRHSQEIENYQYYLSVLGDGRVFKPSRCLKLDWVMRGVSQLYHCRLSGLLTSAFVFPFKILDMKG